MGSHVMCTGAIHYSTQPPETPVLWPPHAKSWLIGKDSDAGRDWGQEEKGSTEDEMAGWHHRLDGHEFGWTRELVMDIEAWPSVIHGVTKSRTWLSDWTELNWIDFSCTESGVATHRMTSTDYLEKRSAPMDSVSSQNAVPLAWWNKYIFRYKRIQHIHHPDIL